MSKTTASPFSLTERLKHGWLSIAEICTLKGVGRSTFYKDARAGLVAITKHGRRSLIWGPDAAAYLASGRE